MKFISSLILCFAPVCFFAQSSPSSEEQIQTIFEQTSNELKEGFQALKNNEPQKASFHFQNVINTSYNQNYAHKPAIIFSAAYGWAIALDQLDQIEDFYKFIGKSICDLTLDAISGEDFDPVEYLEELAELLTDDASDELIDELTQISDEEGAKLADKAKNPLIKKLLELNDSDDE